MRRTPSGNHTRTASSSDDANSENLHPVSVLKFPLISASEQNTEPDRRPMAPEVAKRVRARSALILALNRFHQEEERANAREFFRRRKLSPEKLHEDSECFANCTRTERLPFKITSRTNNLAYEYRFDPSQVLKSLPRTVVIRDDETNSYKDLYGEVVADESDFENGIITLKCNKEPSNTVHLISKSFICPKPIQRALEEVTADLSKGDLTKHGAISDFLACRKPRIKGHNGSSLVDGYASRTVAAVNAALNLDDSALIIQGPPGCGKTHTAAHIIGAMIQAGRRVAVSSNSHAAIRNLLLSAQEHCSKIGVDARFIATTSYERETEESLELTSNAGLSSMLEDSVVVGATAWGFSRTDLINAFDVLIVDEASQVSLANLVAMSRVARNLIVIGDQRQLSQPIKGRHTGNGDLSALDFRMGNMPTVQPEHGIFLGTTYRLHPNICQIISDHVYAGRLRADPMTSVRELQTRSVTSQDWHIPAGIAHVPVVHQGNTQFSIEEVDAAQRIHDQLIGMYRYEGNGKQRLLTSDDILFVTPYNAQVSRLKSRLGSNTRIGTVDKFQGQQAAIVVVSLCTSDLASAASDLSFVLDINRLNVAVSRAETLCVILCSPNLLNTPKLDMDNARRVNFLRALCAHGTTNENNAFSDTNGSRPSMASHEDTYRSSIV